MRRREGDARGGQSGEHVPPTPHLHTARRRRKMTCLKGFSGERPPAVVLGDLALVRPLGMAGVPVILGVVTPDDECLRSRHVAASFVVPGWTGEHSAAAAAALTQLGASLRDTLGCKVPLIYQSDVHLDLLYRHREALSEYYLFLLNDEDLAWALYDKERFYQVAAARGIPIPATLQSGPEIEAGILALREPIVVKPKRKTSYEDMKKSLLGGKAKARVFPTREALLSHPSFPRYKDEIIVQEYIDCPVVDLVSYHALTDETGKLLGSFCGKKSRTSPMFGGDSSCIELTNDASVYAAGRDVAARLGLKGPFKIDFIRDARTGELLVLEINARFNLWHHLGAVHGVNLPLIAYEYLVYGRTAAPAPPVEPRYRWVNLYRDYQAFQEQRAGGEMTYPQWLLSLVAPRNVYSVFAWDDPKPFAAWAGSFIRKRRANASLRDNL